MGRRRIYQTDSDRQRAWRERHQGKDTPTPQERTQGESPEFASASRDHEDKDTSGCSHAMRESEAGEEGGSGQVKEPKVNREAMLGAFRGSLSYDVYQQYQRLKGDDQLMMFYLSWWQRGLTRENVEAAAEVLKAKGQFGDRHMAANASWRSSEIQQVEHLIERRRRNTDVAGKGKTEQQDDEQQKPNHPSQPSGHDCLGPPALAANEIRKTYRRCPADKQYGPERRRNRRSCRSYPNSPVIARLREVPERFAV